MSFSVFDRLEKLTPTKGKNRFHCPVYERNTFTIDPQTGSDQCWNRCANADIREALSPWAQARGKPSGVGVTSSFGKNKKRKSAIKLVAPPTDLELATLPYPVEAAEIKPTLYQGKPAEEIIYPYSPSQWIRRLQWKDPANPKGRGKRFEYRSLDTSGNPQIKGGDAPWPPYRIEEALRYGAGKWVQGAEREKVVEALRSLSYVAITHRSNRHQQAYQQLKEAGVADVASTGGDDDA